MSRIPPKNALQAFLSFLRSQRLFFYFLRSYLVLFVLLLLFGAASYAIAIRQATDSLENANALALVGMSERVETRLHEIERMAYRLTSLSATSRLAFADRYDADFYYRTIAYVDDLWTLWLENDALTPRMFVYFKRSGLVADPTTFYRADVFYERFFQSAGMDADRFYALLTDPASHDRYFPAGDVVLNDDLETAGTYEVMTYVYQMRPALGLDPPGAVFFLIDTREMRGMLEQLELGEGGVAAVVDDEGRVMVKLDRNSGLADGDLAAIALGQRTAEDGSMVYSATSSRSGWRYIALGSPRILMKPVRAIQQSLALLLLAAAAIAVAVAFLQARTTSRPLDRLTRLLSPERQQQDVRQKGFAQLETRVEGLLDDNRVLRSELTDLQSEMEPAILHRIFSGAFNDDGAIAEAAGRIRIALPDPPYALVSFHMLRDPLHEESTAIVQSVLARETVKDILDHLSGCSALVYEMNPMELIWIKAGTLPSGAPPLEALLDQAASLLDAQGFPVGIRVSRPFLSLSMAWWEYARLGSPGAPEEADGTASIPLGRAVEPLMALAFRSQDERLLERLFDLLEREYLEEGLSADAWERRLDEIRRSAAAAVGVQAPPGTTFPALRTLVLEACRAAILGRPRPGSHMRRRILDHVRKNLFRPDLSLGTISAQLRISESYLSRIFKVQTGENLSSYIERCRMEEAVRRLHEGDLSVAAIAEKTGYASDAAFRRAFKRVYGVSPNEFRNAAGR